MNIARQYRMLLVSGVIIALALVGCSSGGSINGPDNTVSGVAAAGAPVIGYAYLKDSAGQTRGPVAIGPDGSFSFDGTGLTAPLYLRAEGTVGTTGYTLHSVAMGPGTTNINPLTNIATARAAGTNDPAAVYNNPADFSVSRTELDAAVAEIRTMLKPLLDAYSANVNPITDPFIANHTNLDAVFDVVTITVDPAVDTIIVTDKATQVVIVQATTSTMTVSDPLTTQEVPSSTIVTNISALQSKMEALIGVLNRGTALRAADLEPYFAAAYGINDGLDRTQTIADWVAEGPTAGGNTISGVSALSLEGVAGEDYHIYGSLTMSDGSSGFWDGGLIFTNEAGTWKLKGNGYKSGIYVLSDTHKWIRIDNTELVETGIMFEVYDRGNLNVNSAVITGPGLPVGGISLSKQAWDPVWLPIDAAYQNSTYRPGNVYVLGDQAISAIPENPEYTVTIYSTVDHTGAPVETRKSRLSKRPFSKSELTQAYFPQLSGVTSHALSAAKIGSTLTFSYGKPSAYPVTWMWSEFYFVGALGGQHASYGQDLLLTGSTAEYTTTAPSWTPSYAELTVQASDVFKRDISVHWMFGTSPVGAIQ